MKKTISAGLLSLTLLASLSVPAAALDVEQARALLEEYYIDELPAEAQSAQSIEQLLDALGDEYTVYYTAEEYAQFLTDIEGETLVGIGVSIQAAFDDGFEILAILPDSPALDAGLQAGDVIVAVNGYTLTVTDSAPAHIAGEEGTPVTLTIRRDGALQDITLLRRTVLVPNVEHEQMGSAGYIDCSSFGTTTSDSVRDALNALDQETAVWVMDLRSNPGGVSNTAAESAGYFLGSQVMVYFRDGDGVYYQTRTTALTPDLTDKPLIVLTSPYTASASELFTAAIRDHRGGISVGQRTYGKGVAQHAFDENFDPELFQGDALKVTVYRFFSPEGTTNHLVGVIPTLVVAPEHTQTIGLILSAPKPERSLKTQKLELCGQTYYLDKQLCLENPDALLELLRAIPPSAQLHTGTGGQYWRPVTPAEVAQMYGLEFVPRTFSDAAGHHYQREIDTLSIYALISGGDDGLFHPELELTRAQLAVMLAGALGLSESSEAAIFSDVPADAWYAGSVGAMTARGFMSGTGNGTFSPDATLTNQELITVLSSVAAWCNIDANLLTEKEVSAYEWLDFYAYPEWAQAAARNLRELGVDVDQESPAATVTRGQATGQLCQLLENIHVLWNQ